MTKEKSTTEIKPKVKSKSKAKSKAKLKTSATTKAGSAPKSSAGSKPGSRGKDRSSNKSKAGAKNKFNTKSRTAAVGNGFQGRDHFRHREANRYQEPVPSREWLIDFFLEKGPHTLEQVLLAHELDAGVYTESLLRRLEVMVSSGQLSYESKPRLYSAEASQLRNGSIRVGKDGEAVLLLPDEDSVILVRASASAVMDADVVRAYVYQNAAAKVRAMVLQVTRRHQLEYIGRLSVNKKGQASVWLFSRSVGQRQVRITTDLKTLKQDQLVKIRLDDASLYAGEYEGSIIEVLGDFDKPGIEISLAVDTYDIPQHFSPDVHEYVRKIPDNVDPSLFPQRRNLSDLAFVTIDGASAKDFDDAVYCEPQAGGAYRLYVAIADVSHYVQSGMPLDHAANERGTSVYFPQQVVPMLPEKLSNGLCSLNPLVPRLVLVCQMEISADGKVQAYQFFDSIIVSKARMTYEDVAVLIEGDDAELKAKYASLMPDFLNLHHLYLILQKERKNRGAVDFESTDTEIIFSSDRKIKKIVPVCRNIAHKIIEECMLSANVCAARFLEDNDLKALFRVHEAPSEEKLKNLRQFLGEFGLSLSGGNTPKAKDFSELLAKTVDRVDVHLINTVVLRSMSQACYTPENAGHFGLAYEAYTHFTSPIRRYPDLLLHRVIKRKLDQKKESKKTTEEDWAALGVHCSMTERRADEAVRDVMMWLKCQYMHEHIGSEFDGVISGVTGFGLFVQLNDLFVDGLIHISSLDNDYYFHDAARHLLMGESKGRAFRLGDKIRVKVMRVNVDEKQIDLGLAE